MKPDMTFKMKWAHGQGVLKGFKKGYKDGYSDGMGFTVKNYSSVILLCLKDKFDFNNDELHKIALSINDTFDSVCQGYLTLNDISKTLEEENGLKISFDGQIVSTDLPQTDSLDGDILENIIKPTLDSNKDVKTQLMEAGGYFDE